jgi:hypothetical protein
MRADKDHNIIAQLISVEHRARLGRAGRAFSRWARGGLPLTDANGSAGLARRGLAGATRPQSAQAIVEFLLVSVPLLAMIFGILEFGIAFFESTTLDFATRDLARATAVCATECDKTVISGTGSVLYRDNQILSKIQGYNINVDDIEYVLIQHVGETEDLPTVVSGVAKDPGRAGPDTYANYQYHWQLYAPSKANFPASDPRKNSVPARASNPNNFKLADALPSQIPSLNSAGGLPMNPDGSNTNFNGYRSNPCSSSSDPTTICRKNIPAAKADGSANTLKANRPIWTGRYQCVPTDRFYVQVVYRHTWITPFLPTVNMTGRTQTLQGFGNNAALFLSTKVYEKVEATLYSNGAC